MNEIIAKWLPVFVEIATTLGALITIIKKFGNLDNVASMLKEIKNLKKQNSDIKQENAEIKEMITKVLRHQKGIKDENIDSSNRK